MDKHKHTNTQTFQFTQDTHQKHGHTKIHMHRHLPYSNTHTMHKQIYTCHRWGGSDKSHYINNTLSEFQTSAETWSRQQQDSSHHHPRDEYVGYHSQGIPYQKQFNEKRKEEQMNRVESELKMNGLLEKILKCVQNRNSIAQKPAILLISTLDQMDAF